MTDLASSTTTSTVPAPAGVPAVEVVDLRKDFLRRDREGGPRSRARRRAPALRGVSFAMERGETRRDPRPERLRQVDAGPPALDAAPARRRQRARLRPRRLRRAAPRAAAGQPRLGRGLVLQEDVRRREPELRRAVLRDDGRRDARRDPAHPRARRLPADRSGESMENLSRGMQQKVALARALLTSPVLLLLDEPTTGLDPRSKLEVQEFIREIRVSHDATILLCTHDLAEAETLADRVGILDRGRLLALEPPDELQGGATAAGTLEEAFFAATGRALEDETDDEDDDDERGSVWHAEALTGTMRAELIGLGGVVERNVYLTSATPVGRRVLRLDGREHAHDRLHRQGRRGDRRARSTSTRRRRRS